MPAFNGTEGFFSSETMSVSLLVFLTLGINATRVWETN
jgi:hypothetical protein